MEEAIERLMKGEYLVEERMMLDATVVHDGTEKVLSSALNDVTLTRCGSLQMIRYSIYVNGKLLCNMGADGVIVATPTGSTGYNMSAGGPIAEPGAKLLMLTPVCAHTLNSRSVISQSDDVVEIVIGAANDGSKLTVEAASDGNERVLMSTGDTLRISKSDKTTVIVKLDERSFLEALQRKMSE
jgi:NAD+ kinase